jgi:segregation and condensation protein A
MIIKYGLLCQYRTETEPGFLDKGRRQMAIPIKLEVFEGPLDLLLHLIDKNKVNIYDIPIVLITQQYMEYVNGMEKKDLNVVSEFLVMAATLLDIKSRMLLPKEVNEDGEEQDPRAELVEKLLEYKMYKYMSYELKDMYIDADKSMYKMPTIPKEIMAYKQPVNLEELVGDMNLAKLRAIFDDIMKRQENRVDPIRSRFGRIEKEEVSLEEKMIYVRNYIMEHEHFSFKELLGMASGKVQVIVTFLAVLELIKMGNITVEQENREDDIAITVISTDFDETMFAGEENTQA